MDMEAVSRVGSGEAVPAAAVEGFLRSVVWSVAAETAGEALVQLLLALFQWGSWSSEIGMVTEKEDMDERFNIPVVRSTKNPAAPEVKEDGETDEDEDDDEDDDDDDVDDQDEDGGEEEFSGDDGNEGEEDDDPEANGGGGSEEEDDEDDEEEDDDGDEDEDDDEDEDEEEEEAQPPSKKRK